MSNNIKQISFGHWLSAARLRTLPLAIAAIGMGNILHWESPEFSPAIMLMAMLTTVFLQVLSNLANDLGDSRHGADNSERKGPARMVQSGIIDQKSMKKAVFLLMAASLLSGLLLLWMAFHDQPAAALPLFIAGLASMAAAWFYTNGTKPYGYIALGDASVLFFFGFLAVQGSVWLQQKAFFLMDLLPAAALGCWSTAVLNLNNMRDIHSDARAGKRTIPMLLGRAGARWYQFVLVTGGAGCLLFYALFEKAAWMAGALPGVLLMAIRLPVVFREQEAEKLDSLLKPQAFGTFLAVAGMFLCRLIF